MKKHFLKYFLLVVSMFAFVAITNAQVKKHRAATHRPSTHKSTGQKFKGQVQAPAATDSNVVVAPAPAIAAPDNDSLPIKKVAKSLRRDEAVVTDNIRDRTPLPYENIRADDAVYRHRLWREIDARQKINLPFRYSADEDNGNQRFISILLQAIQDSAITVFNNVDDRFTTPMTKTEVVRAIVGDKIAVKTYDSLGNEHDTLKYREISLDSIYKFHIKEEVVFDKQTSRLYWRILGIAPVMDVLTSTGVDLGPSELFWVYYPDLRPILAKYEIYNGKNYGARMSWEELFESRMFSGRIYKSTLDNPFNLKLSETPGLKDNTLFQLLEGDNISDKIFNYEQDLWSY